MSSQNDTAIDRAAMFTLSYGLFVLTARDGGRDNGCIINTAMQVTDNPKRICIAVNKSGLTHDMVLSSGSFNLSVLTERTPFSVFERFGFHSGRDTDKFADSASEPRTGNGLVYLPSYANAVISANVTDTADLGSHTLFTAEVTEARTLSDTASATYNYYFANIKPKPEKTAAAKKRYECRICGFIYEGDELPADYICPICGHGAEDFELI